MYKVNLVELKISVLKPHQRLHLNFFLMLINKTFCSCKVPRNLAYLGYHFGLKPNKQIAKINFCFTTLYSSPACARKIKHHYLW